MGNTGTQDQGASSLVLPSAKNFPFLHRAIADVLGGVSDRTVLLVGDSILAGNFADTGLGPIPSLVKLLNGVGINSQFGLSGPQNTSTAGTGGGVDGRWTLGANWALQAPASQEGWGARGNYLVGAAGAGTLAYKPAVGSYDTFDVYYFTTTAASGFSVNFNGGGDTVVNADTGAAGVGKVTVAGAATATPNCNIHAITGFAASILSVEGRLSTTPTLRIGNVGSTGAQSGDWVNNTNHGYDPRTCIQTYAPDVSIIALGINDALNNQTPATVLANLALLVTACKASGDVIICTENPATTAGVSAAEQNAIFGALSAFASSEGCGFVDVYNAWGTVSNWANLNTDGYFADANVHPSLFGQGDWARLLAAGLVGL